MPAEFSEVTLNKYSGGEDGWPKTMITTPHIHVHVHVHTHTHTHTHWIVYTATPLPWLQQHLHVHTCSTQTCPNTDPKSYNVVSTMNTGIQKHHSSSPVKGFRPLSVSGVCRYTSHKHLSPEHTSNLTNWDEVPFSDKEGIRHML